MNYLLKLNKCSIYMVTNDSIGTEEESGDRHQKSSQEFY